MRITLKRDTFRALGRGASAVSGAAELVETAAGRLREQTENYAQRLRLTRAIRDLEEEADLQLRAVGELLYATYRGTPSDSGSVQEILEYVDSLYEEMDGHRRQLELLRENFPGAARFR